VALLAAILFVWWLSGRSTSLQAAVAATGAVVAAGATAWSAYQSRLAAGASAAAARDARLALALRDRPWPFVSLWRWPGNEGSPWQWVVYLGQGKKATDLRMRWSVDGRQRQQSRAWLEGQDLWRHDAFLDSGVRAADVRSHIAAVEVEWQDPDGRMRWRSEIEIVEGASRGTPSPFTPLDSGFIEQEIPLVNNGEPSPVW
jgi:hypothetical protein